MDSVTYKGPSDPVDPSNVFVVPGNEPGDADHRFPKGQRVDDVPADVIAVCEAAEGHEFDVGATAKRPKAEAQEEASALGIEFTDRTTVAELEDLIAAKRAEGAAV